MELTQKEINARFYRNRKENGLCPRCGKPLDREGHYCIECLAKINKYKKESREFYRKNHLCVECGKYKVPETEKICPECRAKSANRRKTLTDNQKESYQKKFNTHQKMIYKERKQSGICTRCGKRKAASGRAKCLICLEKDAEKHRNKSDIYDKQEYKRENHLCYYCGEKIDLDTGNICSKCKARLQEIGKKNGGNNNYWKNDNEMIRRKIK